MHTVLTFIRSRPCDDLSLLGIHFTSFTLVTQTEEVGWSKKILVDGAEACM